MLLGLLFLVLLMLLSVAKRLVTWQPISSLQDGTGAFEMKFHIKMGRGLHYIDVGITHRHVRATSRPTQVTCICLFFSHVIDHVYTALKQARAPHPLTQS